MSNPYCFTFSTIELTVRYCDNQANDLDLIGSYVHLGLQRAKSFKQITNVRSAHMRVVNILVETMCDSNLPLVWREHCYLYIKRLMPLLFEMLDSEEYQKKSKQIMTLHKYFIRKQVLNDQADHTTITKNLIKRANQ
ncbi:hypothetical protein [Paraglaciecola sp.]|uniref:hypothetical protein n=1 Tax=Paraglaciecola sp. TaxID=1920173 RepID=UPI003EF3E58C